MIITPPRDITVFLDQEPAVFSCEIDGGLPEWRVNGTSYNSLSSEIRTDIMTDNGVSENGYTLLTLIIPARAEYNETTVQCATLNAEKYPTESEIVLFNIQGDYKRTSMNVCGSAYENGCLADGTYATGAV